MSYKSLVIAIFAAIFTTVAGAQTTLSLNTGYNHANYNLYTTVSSAPSTTFDQYWINIASYPTTSPAVGPTYVLPQPSYWSTSLPNSHWISAWNDPLSQAGVNQNDPGYNIFRKCFCLGPNYRSPQISFTARSDDTIQVWLNSHLNTLIPVQFGGFNGAGIQSSPASSLWFREGLNCLYVLVEDTFGGATGFNLDGSVTAFGLGNQAALGVEQTFDCPCTREAHPVAPQAAQSENDVLAAIIEIAEQRRLDRIAIPRIRR